jgi:hypothetical protein
MAFPGYPLMREHEAATSALKTDSWRRLAVTEAW